MDIKLVLVDVNKEIYEEFMTHFGDLQNVQIFNKPFQELEVGYDCIVSPANSFGLMNGGLDKYLIEYFGKQVEKRVQQTILHQFAGEQPIGTSFIVETMHPHHPFIAHTPTMRVPSVIRGSDAPYLAMKAMLLAVKQHNEVQENKISTVVCSGLGTMVGRIAPSLAVKQMRLAYDVVSHPVRHLDWLTAMEHHKEIENLR